jgi:glycosyltransferase involved in cell wall biosynthesis
VSTTQTGGAPGDGRMAGDAEPTVERQTAATQGGPRVSIGLPVWNGEDFLPKALDSLLGQTFSDFELIISDNASTDATQAICLAYGERERRIRYYRNETNLGLQANTQKVLDLATAPLFMWACHDDEWDPTYLAKMVEQLDRDSSLVLAGSNAASIDERGTLRTFYDIHRVYVLDADYERARRMISEHPQGGHAFLIVAVMRTHVAQRLSLADFNAISNLNRGKYAWDKRALFRLLFEGRFWVSNETMYYHRDVNDAWWGRRRPADTSLRAKLHRATQHSLDLHDYFGTLRRIVLGSRLTPGQKTSLVAISGLQEIRYLVAFYVARLGLPSRRRA